MENWITEAEHAKALEKGEEIFASWLNSNSPHDVDDWLDIKIGNKIFDLNLWTENSGNDCYVNIHPTKINDSRQIETIGSEFIRLISLEQSGA